MNTTHVNIEDLAEELRSSAPDITAVIDGIATEPDLWDSETETLTALGADLVRAHITETRSGMWAEGRVTMADYAEGLYPGDVAGATIESRDWTECRTILNDHSWGLDRSQGQLTLQIHPSPTGRRCDTHQDLDSEFSDSFPDGAGHCDMECSS